jgi:hypothetical protein
MSRRQELLTLRKELLIARASVERLRMAQQLGVLHEELRPARVARSVLGSARTHAMLLGLLPLVVRRGRMGRWARRASIALSVARTVMGFVRARADAAGSARADAAGSAVRTPRQTQA